VPSYYCLLRKKVGGSEKSRFIDGLSYWSGLSDAWASISLALPWNHSKKVYCCFGVAPNRYSRRTCMIKWLCATLIALIMVRCWRRSVSVSEYRVAKFSDSWSVLWR